MPKLLLITFIDFGEMKSGSSVRPQRICEAFKKLGFEVNLLSGLQNRKRERWQRVFHKFLEIRRSLPDFCYVEPPSGPFFNFCDHLLLLYLKMKKVPIGLFYRDAYWKFADWWHIKGIKRLFLTLMHRFDLFIFRRTCSIVYFPTKSMAALFSLPHKCVLPPAGTDRVVPPHAPGRSALYVGGVSGFYGTDIMLEAFEILNERMHRDIRLTVVCREKEMRHFFDGYLGRPWLEVAHASGDEALAPYYEACDLALYPSRRDLYMDFCMPVKLFEYLSRGLPVACTDCHETAAFVTENGFGAVAKSDPEDYAAVIVSLFDDPQRLETMRANAVSALREGNLWEHRAQRAAREIMGAAAGSAPRSGE
ncbi:MAG: glycosyltransferase family 4 protein [Clostridia bacterium]|nr:glycosyltransferase family 4 protein [Clostridia bacterium]